MWLHRVAHGHVVMDMQTIQESSVQNVESQGLRQHSVVQLVDILQAICAILQSSALSAESHSKRKIFHKGLRKCHKNDL